VQPLNCLEFNEKVAENEKGKVGLRRKAEVVFLLLDRNVNVGLLHEDCR